MTIFFTADTHFGHKKMLELRFQKLGLTEFSAPWEMDEVLIKNWNNIVSDKDEVWHLGDVSFSNWGRTGEVLSQLNGRKHLIFGNHDKPVRNKLSQYFESTQDYRELKYGDQTLVLFHYPIHKWNKGHYGTIHLCGHSHGNLLQENIRRFDVGVDTDWANYSPISIERIIEEAEKYPLAPYHH